MCLHGFSGSSGGGGGGGGDVTPRSISISKSHWLADSLTSASGRRTPDGPPPVTTAPCLRSLTVGVGIKQGEILGRTEQNKHAHNIYTVHDEIQEVISYTMFPVRYAPGAPPPVFATYALHTIKEKYSHPSIAASAHSHHY